MIYQSETKQDSFGFTLKAISLNHGSIQRQTTKNKMQISLERKKVVV